MGSQRGDEAELFASFNDELLRLVARAVNTSRDNVEDACAMAWAVFLRTQPDRDRNWRGYMYRVATREAIRLDQHERRRTHFRREGDPDPGGILEPADPKAESGLRAAELREALGLIERVPERRRSALVLSLIGLRYDEIGEILGVSKTRVNRLLVEANAQLREEIVSHQGVAPERTRLTRLVDLERERPAWLVRVIGRPPRLDGTRKLLAWRHAERPSRSRTTGPTRAGLLSRAAAQAGADGPAPPGHSCFMSSARRPSRRPTDRPSIRHPPDGEARDPVSDEVAGPVSATEEVAAGTYASSDSSSWVPSGSRGVSPASRNLTGRLRRAGHGTQVLYDEFQGTAMVLQYFDTAEDMSAGAQALGAMDPSETPGTRASVDMCELKLEGELA
jgi:RNA polymerase sigma factor (sigma-70 family)